ncbi:MAG: hypothetical protein JF606_13860 [Burkholderiales bacterium]|jgi:hypothetical protein|nr:hypothetical protein [Burkholderiales bacterium]
MSNEPVKPRLSELSQYVTRGEEAVRVDIYENGEGGWILEIIDRYNNSTVWDDPFPSDQSALDEAYEQSMQMASPLMLVHRQSKLAKRS